MKGFVRCCALALAACLTLAGCAPALPPQPTLDELLAEVNAAHQAIDNDGLRGRFALRQPVNENGEPISTSERYSYYTTDLEPYFDQMIEDVTYLFDSLYPDAERDRRGGAG